MKRTLPIILMLIMLLAAACQKGAPARAVQAPAEAPPEVITINLGHFANDNYAAIIDQLVTAFETRYPEYRINKVAPPSDTSDHRAELRRRLQAGEYDIFPIMSNDRDSWEELDPFLKRSLPALQKVADAADALRMNGYIYGLPIMLEPEGFLVNRGMWEAAGLTLPGESWTWDEFRTAAAKLTQGTEANRVWGVGTEQHEFLFTIWLMQRAGRDFWLADEAVLREGFHFFRGLVQTDQSMPAPEVRDWGTSWFMNPYARAFFEKQAAIGYTGIFPLSLMNQWAPFAWDVLPIPTQPGQRPVMRVRPFVYQISALSTKQDAAWEFLRFAVSPEGAAIVAANGAIPTDGAEVTKGAWAGLKPAPPSGMVHLLTTPWVADGIPFDGKSSRLVGELLRLTNLCLRGQIDPDTAVTQYLEFRKRQV